MTRIYPGQHPSQAVIAPPNPTLHYSKVPAYQVREWPKLEHAEPGEYYYCSQDGFWKRVVSVVPEGHHPTRNLAMPLGDGSGVHWHAIDRHTKARLWTIEAFSFEDALNEKRWLCKQAGGKSGDVYLILAPKLVPVPVPVKLPVATRRWFKNEEGRLCI